MKYTLLRENLKWSKYEALRNRQSRKRTTEAESAGISSRSHARDPSLPQQPDAKITKDILFAATYRVRNAEKSLLAGKKHKMIFSLRHIDNAKLRLATFWSAAWQKVTHEFCHA